MQRQQRLRRVGTAHQCVIAAALALCALRSAALAQDEGMLLAPKAFRAAVERILPSVVIIETYGSSATPVAERPAPGPRPGPRPGGRRGGGISKPGEGPTTGLIVSADGLILTSTYNFLRGQPIITVVLRDGSQHVAKLLGRDETRKLCVLKVEGVRDLPVPKTAGPQELKVGQWAISVGYGYGGHEPAISSGIISATRRMSGRAVQTDANLSPANYGGPLIDIEGRVLGICVPLSPQSRETAGGTEWYDSGIGFAVPVHGAEGLIKRMASGETIRPGWLGIRPATESKGEGVTIEEVQPNSPAAGAGLKKGDIIVAINGQAVADTAALADVMNKLAAGDSLTLVYKQGGEEKTATLTLAEPPATPVPPVRPATTRAATSRPVASRPARG